MKKIILAAAALLTLIPATHAAELRSADIHPDDYPTVQAVRQFGELVKQRTNGRITVKVYAGGALGNEDDSIEQVKLGALAMARVSSAAMRSVMLSAFWYWANARAMASSRSVIAKRSRQTFLSARRPAPAASGR